MYKFYICALNSDNLKDKNDHITSKLKLKEYPTILTISKNGSLKIYNNSITRDNIQYYISLNSL